MLSQIALANLLAQIFLQTLFCPTAIIRVPCIPLVAQEYPFVAQAYHVCISNIMSKNGKDKTISIRLSQTMLEALDARAVLDEKDRTQVIREAINRYLELPEDSAEDRIDFLEGRLEKLYTQNQHTEKRTIALERRVNELSRLIALCLERRK